MTHRSLGTKHVNSFVEFLKVHICSLVHTFVYRLQFETTEISTENIQNIAVFRFLEQQSSLSMLTEGAIPSLQSVLIPSALAYVSLLLIGQCLPTPYLLVCIAPSDWPE